MKRIIALILCLIMAVCAVACDGGNTPAETTKAPEQTQAPATDAPVETTEAPVETTEAPVEDTDAPAETNAPEATKAPETEAPKESGCGSMISGGAVLAIICLAAVSMVKKNRD